MKEPLAAFTLLTELCTQRLDLMCQIFQPFRFGPTPVAPFRVEMIIPTEQAIPALRAFAKTSAKKLEKLALDLCKSRLLNLLALCHVAPNYLN